MHVRVYRATFGTTPLRAQFILSPDGKIAGPRDFAGQLT